MGKVIIVRMVNSFLRQDWPVISGFIERALAQTNGEIWPEDLLEMALKHEADFWLVKAYETGDILAVCVTQVVLYKRKKNLRVVALTGDGMEEWMDALDETLCYFGRAEGCSSIELVGRKGFVRRLKPLGYEEKYVLMTRSLENEQKRGTDGNHVNNGPPEFPATIC